MFRFAVVLLVALIAGCSANPITGRSQLMMVSEEHAVRGSASAYQSMIGGLKKKNKVETGTPRVQRVREITDRLIAQAVRFRPESAGWKWEIEVIEEPKAVNAFAMAGGKMAIYTGFWETFRASDEEVAAVLGHEIGHALASHTREQMSVGLSTQLGAMVAAALLSRNDPDSFGRNAGALSTAAELAVTLPNSREAENEADQIGIELAARAGFDPKAAISLWQKMQKQGGQPPEFLSTHPSHETRIARLTALAAKVEPLYRQAIANPVKAPSFLGQEYAEKGSTQVSRADYAARVAAEPQAMTFVAEGFERFARGDMVFDCRAACALAYQSNRAGWKRLHAAGQWRDLAVSVAQVGYLSDLSYFLLGEAAKGLRLAEPAKRYYARAVAASKAGNACAGIPDTCEGFAVQKLAEAGAR